MKATAEPEQAELVIDPGQAFGTGGHASTLLALEWLDAVAPGLGPGRAHPRRGCRQRDPGAGGAAPRPGHCRGLRPRPAGRRRHAASNAVANGLAGRLRGLHGPARGPAAHPFDLVLANLLKTELLPLAEGIAARTAPGGRAVFSGLLEGERQAVAQALRAAGLRLLDTRQREDASGERWVSLLMTR